MTHPKPIPIQFTGDGINGPITYKNRHLNLDGKSGLVFQDLEFSGCGQIRGAGAHHITFYKCGFLFLLPDNQKQFQLFPGNDFWTWDSCWFNFCGDGIYSNYRKNDPADGAQQVTVKNCDSRNIGTHPEHPSRDGHFVGLQGGSGHKIINNFSYHTGTAIELWARKDMPMRDCAVENNKIYWCQALANENGSGTKFSGETGAAKGLRTGNICRNNYINTCDGYGISSNWPDEIAGLASNTMANCKAGNLRMTGLKP